MVTLQKVSFLKVYHFFINQHFPDAKTLIMRAVIAENISSKESWYQTAAFSNYGCTVDSKIDENRCKQKNMN